ncbi:MULTISPECIES: DUF58 domain-containing protein [unclassified Microbulbifer]|uniref:DUF58 domain-containing protein n=1 Tax=Microbulbifer spongiae TaxID=2944933 RepID=A0ABY9EBD9_9GAMM|nr:MULTISPECIES: DUF58 domain-containing protein [unclassified Microbulbifer]MDP5208826.1 DUF58 domain-containing protein [Microbulbifer sp. 2205BS26-8]WKD49477.1 DUF58 domain-containing protein [Microbulbifer sp. MI-G]
MVLIPPKTLASCRDLVWLSRHIAEGVMLGVQHSQRRGTGLVFHQYRGYQAGDSIRHIDWKLFARSDRYYVRETEQESRMHVCFVLDTSASLGQASFVEPSLNKLHYAKCWIASLCWLLDAQGDSFSLLAINNQQTRYIPEGQGESHQRQIALQLQQLDASHHWPDQSQLAPLWQHFERPCQVVLLSDFFEQDNEISNFAARLHAAGRPCLPLQLLVEAEQTFPFKGELKLLNPEANSTGPVALEVDAERQRHSYLTAFARAQGELKARFAAKACVLQTDFIEQPVEKSLRQFIQHHGRLC